MPVPEESIGTPPWCAEDVSVNWLNEVLGRHDDFRGAKVSSFDIDRVGGEFGFIREVQRLKLRYERGSSSTPGSVVAKFADRDPKVKSLFAPFSAREVDTYRHLGADSEFIMPRCYYSDFDPETGDCAILMEDLGRGRQADNIDGFWAGDAEELVKAIAVFHARWWGTAELDQPRWQPLPFDRAARQLERFMPDAQTFLEKYGEQVDGNFREVISLYSEKLIPIIEAASNPPRTLIHGDLHMDNVFFDTDFRGCPVTAIDWAGTGRGRGATDIAYLAVLGLAVNLRRSIEHKLVRIYHTTLVAEGVAGYSLEQCQADYRSGLLHPFHITLRTLGYLDLSDERGKYIAGAKIERTSAALREHDLVGLLHAM